MSKKTVKTPSFETKVKQLSDVVNKMETGNLSLENALKQFEKGVELTRQCQETLEKAEQSVELLIEKNGILTTEPFDERDEDDSEHEYDEDED